jgi:hypothetical protein
MTGTSTYADDCDCIGRINHSFDDYHRRVRERHPIRNFHSRRNFHRCGRVLYRGLVRNLAVSTCSSEERIIVRDYIALLVLLLSLCNLACEKSESEKAGTAEVKNAGKEIETAAEKMTTAAEKMTTAAEILAAQRSTGRSFLRSNESEAPGYGLYSYLLLAHPSSGKVRERYLAAVKGYLGHFNETTSLELRIPKEALNVFYVLVGDVPVTQQGATTTAAKAASEPILTSTDEAALWIVDHYDYTRAQSILRLIPGKHEDGPYIVSFEEPLTGRVRMLNGKYLYQDLSAVDPSIVPAWLQFFEEQANKPAFWQEDKIEKTLLTLRDKIAQAASHISDVKESLKEWIKWVK